MFQNTLPWGQGSATVQPPLAVLVPLFAEAAIRPEYVAPPSVEYSSFTLATEPLLVHVIVRGVLTSQASPPFGAVRVKPPWILNVASESSKTETSEAPVTRTLTVEERSSGTVQAKDPVPGAEAVIRTSEAKLSFEYSRRTFGIVPLVVQVMVRLCPTVHSSPPLGALTVIPPRILKLLSEASLAEGSAASATRIFAVVEIASGTAQLKLPVLAAEATITVAVAKLSMEYSSLTLGTEPVFVHVIDCVVPTAQTSPPLGAVRMKPPRMVKLAAEAPKTVTSAVFVTRTLTVVEASSGTVQAKLPVLATEAAISVALAKLSLEYSSFTLGLVPVDVQVIVCGAPIVQTSPPFGALTAMLPRILKFASEVSFVEASVTSETRTLTVLEIASGIVHEKLPVLGAEAATTLG